MSSQSWIGANSQYLTGRNLCLPLKTIPYSNYTTYICFPFTFQVWISSGEARDGRKICFTGCSSPITTNLQPTIYWHVWSSTLWGILANNVNCGKKITIKELLSLMRFRFQSAATISLYCSIQWKFWSPMLLSTSFDCTHWWLWPIINKANIFFTRLVFLLTYLQTLVPQTKTYLTKYGLP